MGLSSASKPSLASHFENFSSLTTFGTLIMRRYEGKMGGLESFSIRWLKDGTRSVESERVESISSSKVVVLEGGQDWTSLNSMGLDAIWFLVGGLGAEGRRAQLVII